MQVNVSDDRELTVEYVAQAVADDMLACIGNASDGLTRDDCISAVMELVLEDNESAFFLLKKHVVGDNLAWTDEELRDGSFIEKHSLSEYLIVDASFLTTIEEERGLYTVLKGYAIHGSLYKHIFGTVQWPTRQIDCDSEMFRAACYLMGGAEDDAVLLMKRLHENNAFMSTSLLGTDGEVVPLDVARFVMLTGMEYGDVCDIQGILDVPVEIILTSAEVQAGPAAQEHSAAHEALGISEEEINSICPDAGAEVEQSALMAETKAESSPVPFVRRAYFARGVFIGDPIHVLRKEDFERWQNELSCQSGFVEKADDLLMIVHPLQCAGKVYSEKHNLQFPLKSGYIAAVNLDFISGSMTQTELEEHGAYINVGCVVDMRRDESGAYSFRLHRRKERNIRVTIDMDMPLHTEP